MGFLQELERFKSIAIQTHDNPDPDALASAFALYDYFTAKGKRVRILYSGRNKIQKSNLVLMVNCCEIPIEYVNEGYTVPEEVLITVDCQYGEGNVSKLKARYVVIVDHHQGTGEGDEKYIYPYLGSCSTLIWNEFRKEKYEYKRNSILSTALYYGLMTDTGNLAESNHPLDRDMVDDLVISKPLVKLWTNSNISLQELEIAGQALIHYDYDDDNKSLLIYSKPCDPNILGFINDLALQVDKIMVSVVYNELDLGFKVSVRSCTKEVRANEFASFITESIGSGGGHADKAGGYIDKDLFKKEYAGVEIEDYFRERIDKYFKTSQVIYAKDYEISLDGMQKYSKIEGLKSGYVVPTEILPVGSRIRIRTLEGDIDTYVSDDLYINIGVNGEAYPTSITKFNTSYEKIDEPYVFDGEYEPTVHDLESGEVLNLVPFVKSCVSKGTSVIYARELTSTVKIFTMWDDDKYYLGKPGDYLACRFDDHKDVYVIEKTIFNKTYQLAKE